MNFLPQRRHARVTVSAGRTFALHAWQQSGQCCTSSGRVKVFPHTLHVLVIIPRDARACPLPANSAFSHSNTVIALLISSIPGGRRVRPV